MWIRWIRGHRALVFVTALFTLALAISCGSAAQPEPEAAGQEAAQGVTTAQESGAGSGGGAPTATPAPATGGGGMVESSVVRLIEAQGETTQEGNWTCAGNRPFHTENLRTQSELLIGVNPETAQLQPWLAESWEPSADFTSWTFRLRKGVPFHFDYGEFTAEDVAWMAETLGRDDCLASTTSFWQEMERAEVIDDFTVPST
jgi:ABC-type transport system substrate-binding protein